MATQTEELLWQYFINAVKQDVKPALGCTEPISLAYAAAKAASYLPSPVVRVAAFVSPNLMKMEWVSPSLEQEWWVYPLQQLWVQLVVMPMQV